MAIHVHLIRHGEIASHQGDVPLTELGKKVALDEGRKLGEKLVDHEKLYFLYASTNRTRQTAEKFREGILETIEKNNRTTITIFEPKKEYAIRNPDIYLAGLRVELVSSAEALAEQVPSTGLTAEHLKYVPFWPEFWNSSDRIGYWLELENPPGENANEVARRIMNFVLSFYSLPNKENLRFICATHSPVLRAFLNKYLLDEDPGEPEYCESINLQVLNESTCHIQFRSIEKTICI